MNLVPESPNGVYVSRRSSVTDMRDNSRLFRACGTAIVAVALVGLVGCLGPMPGREGLAAGASAGGGASASGAASGSASAAGRHPRLGAEGAGTPSTAHVAGPRARLPPWKVRLRGRHGRHYSVSP